MRKGYPSNLRGGVVGYASAGFAEAVKMARAEARGASLIIEAADRDCQGFSYAIQTIDLRGPEE